MPIQSLRRPSSLAAAVLLAAAAPSLYAQSADPVGPRARSWGAEVMFPDARVSLLRFMSTRTALLLTVSGFAGTTERDVEGLPGFEDEDNSISSIAVGIGVRRYGGTGSLRPVRGLGVFGGTSHAENGIDQTRAGAYAELGAHWFFTPHVSLGAVGELRGEWRREEAEVGIGGKVENTTMTIGVTLVRVGGAVYF